MRSLYHRAIPLADKGFVPVDSERNPVRWYVERWPDDPNPRGPYADQPTAEDAAARLNSESF